MPTWIVRFEGFLSFKLPYLLIPKEESSFFIREYSLSNSSNITVLARPKSQSLTSVRSTLVRIFSGFKSRCSTWHSWQYLSPTRIWKTTCLIWFMERILLEKNVFLRSFSRYSKTKYNVTFSFSSTMTYFSSTMNGCFRCLSRIISLKTLVDSCTFVKKLLIFFIATISFVFIFRALITVEDTPWPRGCIISYLFAMIYACFIWFCTAFLRYLGFIF